MPSSIFKSAILVAAILLLASCQKNNSIEFKSIEISPEYFDSLNIRALLPLDVDRVWFAADKGIVGFIDGDILKASSLKYDDRRLHFRSVAQTKDAVFVLSIASPAVLYKIGFDGTDVTSIEEVYTESGEKVFYDSMKFWNDEEGIAIGDPIDDCLTVIITRDGGNTWKKIGCDDLPVISKGEVAFAASNSNIAVYGDNAWIATGGKHSRVMHTSDKGKTWGIYDTPIISGEAMTGIYTIDFFDENNGIVFGGNWKEKEFNQRNKAITSDGGKTWKLVADGKDPGYGSSVKYIPGSKGKEIVVVSDIGVSYSPDGGHSWQKLSEESFYAMEFVNDTMAFASGQNKISKLIFNR